MKSILCFSMNASSMTQGASRTTSSTQRQCDTASYRSSSVITVLPLYLCVSASLQTPTSRYVLGKLGVARVSAAAAPGARRALRRRCDGTLGALHALKQRRAKAQRGRARQRGARPRVSRGASAQAREATRPQRAGKPSADTACAPRA